MPLEEKLLEAIVNIVRRTVFVRLDLLYHDTLFNLYLILWERRLRSKLYKQLESTGQILLKDSSMDDGFLLGSKRVKLPAKKLQAGIYTAGAAVSGTLKDCMFSKMGYSAGKRTLVAGTAANSQGAIAHSGACATHGVTDTLWRNSGNHTPLSSFGECLDVFFKQAGI